MAHSLPLIVGPEAAACTAGILGSGQPNSRGRQSAKPGSCFGICYCALRGRMILGRFRGPSLRATPGRRARGGGGEQSISPAAPGLLRRYAPRNDGGRSTGSHRAWRGQSEGLAVLEGGGDFADGIIAFDGRRAGGLVFTTFDTKAAAMVRATGGEARLLWRRVRRRHARSLPFFSHFSSARGLASAGLNAIRIIYQASS